MGENRRGFTLIEILAAGALLGVALVVSLRLVQVTADQGRAVRQREVAVQETVNVMERLCARRWQELTPETARKVQLSAQARDTLPGGELKIEITPGAEQPESKRISVVVSWEDVPGRPNRPARLVAWRYRNAGDQ